MSATTSERVEVTSRVVSCDGVGGALGHPLVWLRIEASEIMCPYCSRLFVLKPGTGDDHGH